MVLKANFLLRQPLFLG